jgi:hypothetical protein
MTVTLFNAGDTSQYCSGQPEPASVKLRTCEPQQEASVCGREELVEETGIGQEQAEALEGGSACAERQVVLGALMVVVVGVVVFA